MKIIKIILLTAVTAITVNAMQPPPGARVKPPARGMPARRALLQELISRQGSEASFAVPQEVPGAARTRISGYKRKTEQPEREFYVISHEQILIDYLQEHLQQADVKAVLEILSRLQRRIAQETYFDDMYWIQNDGRDLRELAKNLVELINSSPAYADIIKDPYFIDRLTKYLSDRYPGTTEQLRAVIPFASLPAASSWITKAFNYKEDFEAQWCKELSILVRWLDASTQKGDSFYQDGILLLINSLPANHPLLTKQDSCLKPLLFHVAYGYYEPIFDALIKKGINVNWKNGQDETPLFNAAFHGDVSMVQKLLDAGADAAINTRSIYTRTALDHAYLSKSANRNSIINMLIDRGAHKGEAR